MVLWRQRYGLARLCKTESITFLFVHSLFLALAVAYTDIAAYEM